MPTIIVHILFGCITYEVKGSSIMACLLACAQFAEPGWTVAQTTTVTGRRGDIQSFEVQFDGGGCVHFSHIRDNLYNMAHF